MKELFSQNSKWALFKFFMPQVLGYFLIVGTFLIFAIGGDFNVAIGVFYVFAAGFLDFRDKYFKKDDVVEVPVETLFVALTRVLIFPIISTSWKVFGLWVYYMTRLESKEPVNRHKGFFVRFRTTTNEYSYEKIKKYISTMSALKVESESAIVGYSFKGIFGSIQVSAVLVENEIIISTYPQRLSLGTFLGYNLLLNNDKGEQVLAKILDASKYEKTN